MREILVDWTTQAGSGMVGVFNFSDETPVNAQRVALGAFLGGMDEQLRTTTTWTVRQEGREVNDATGTLTGEWLDSAVVEGNGAGAQSAVADATQALIRWSTGVVVNGRFLKGRTFIPGLEIDVLSGGNLTTAAQVAFTTAADGLATAGVGFSIWHRPTSGAGGSLHAVAAGSVWSELAVLRRRRK